MNESMYFLLTMVIFHCHVTLLEGKLPVFKRLIIHLTNKKTPTNSTTQTHKNLTLHFLEQFFPGGRVTCHPPPGIPPTPASMGFFDQPQPQPLGIGLQAPSFPETSNVPFWRPPEITFEERNGF